jgi:hypothetical protein
VKFKATVEGLSRAQPSAESSWTKEPMKRWLAPIAVGIVLLGAVLGGTLVSLWLGRKSDSEAGTKVAELTATVTKSDKARQDAEAKADQATAALTKSDKARQDAEAKANQAAAALAKSEQARQAAEAKAADAEKGRQAAAAKADDADKARQAALARADDADRTRRTAEAKAVDAEKARLAAVAKADDADKARHAAEAKASQATTAQEQPAQSDRDGFTISSDTDAIGPQMTTSNFATMNDCLKQCANESRCRAFTFTLVTPVPGITCWLYSSASFSPRPNFVSGKKN